MNLSSGRESTIGDDELWGSGCLVIGGYCRNTGDCFLAECPRNNRDKHTLTRLIKQYVQPGTIILTDKWKGYCSLSQHGYTHLSVNHSRGFVDPITGFHTNTCEGMWFHAKRHMQLGTGRSPSNSSNMAIALSEFLWMKMQNLTRTDPSIRQNFGKEIPELMRRVFYV